ncbi:MAG: acyl-ACP--UDP-N-acetylglucosamine O-acyltransferase [Gammaproteobacteria bacterium]
MIDTRTDIHPSARIAPHVTIGPWTVIGPDVEIGEGTEIGSHVVIQGSTRIGKNNKIFQFASVGADPQDKKYQGEKTLLNIGDNNVIREFCTLNRGTTQGGGVTQIGDGNLFMAYVHIAHDCLLGNNIIFANGVTLAGHVRVNDFSIVGGLVAVHQFCTIGAHSFIAGGSVRIVKDVLPFLLISDQAEPCGLNREGLKRRGFTPETLLYLRRAYKVIFRQGLTIPQAIDTLQEMIIACPEISLLIEGLEKSERGVLR